MSIWCGRGGHCEAYSTTRNVALARAIVSPSLVTRASTKPIERPALIIRGVICIHWPRRASAPGRSQPGRRRAVNRAAPTDRSPRSCESGV